MLKIGQFMVALSLMGACLSAWAQLVTGSIQGSVSDTSGSVVPGAKVTLVAESTSAARETASDGGGNFVFNAVSPGAYTLTVELEGFKKYEQKRLVLPANERLSTGSIRLEIGTLAESVTVTAEGATVQTASGERSGLVTSKQVENLNVLTRDFSSLLALMPGVVADDRGEMVGDGINFNVQGSRITGNSIGIDGLATNNLGNHGRPQAFVSMDAISEVKILTTNFQAEFGSRAGAMVQAVTKSGGQQFHGQLYWYKRHEQFNANSFFNNRNGIREAPYRYTTAGFNIGGPVFIPGKFNTSRSKLFFFFSSEHMRSAQPQPIRSVTMPTTAERRGDFSESRDLNARVIAVRDPQSGQPFPGNVIPPSRIQRWGQSYLNLLPQPNFFDLSISGNRYNYQVQESIESPRHGETVRIDYHPRQNTNLYWRYSKWFLDQRGFAVTAPNSNWGWLPSTFQDINDAAVLSLHHIFSPTLILEASMSAWDSSESGSARNAADLDRLNRASSGITIPQFHPENNPLNLVPNASFGGITGAASTQIEPRFPIGGGDTLFSWNATLSKSHTSHTLKFGFAADRLRNYEGVDGNFNGTFNFSRDVNNPNDSNHPYANALLGNFASYSESTTRPWVQGRATILEWFAQDNWKVNRRLTLDLGLRFSWTQPYYHFRREEAGFVPDRYDASRQVRLIQPVRVGNQVQGRHPVTGQQFPGVAVGAIAPGVGDPYNGIVNTLVDRSYPRGMRDPSGLKLSPRFGFALDPFGKGKTAIRGGFGMFRELRDTGGRRFGLWSNPPLREDPIIYYGNLNTFINSTGVTFPSATTGFQRNWPVETTMNYSFGIQQNIGLGTVVDAAYVGSLGRFLAQGRNLNAIPFGSNFNPAHRDPANPGRPLPAAFLRPFVGYNNITYFEYAGNSSYHSLQVTANRRFARSLEFGAAWTWSKAMDYTDQNSGAVSNLISPKVWNYGRAGFDRTHILKINWIWDLPGGSALWKNAFSRAVLDGWQVSGIATFSSGAPSGIGLSFVTNVDITGSPTDGARVVVVDRPTIPKGERTFSRNFNTDAFRAPAVGTFGNAAKDLVRAGGLNNWDVSLFKNFLIRERLRLQFRSEFYNAFNHTQFTGMDTGARFDAQGRQVNARLGEYTSAAPPRRVQFALRLNF